MAFNGNKLRAKLGNEKRKALVNKKFSDNLTFISTSSLEPGEYIMRFLPAHPTRNPDCYFTRSVHKLETRPNADLEKFICPRTYDNDAACFACDCLDEYSNDPVGLSPSVVEALNKLIADDETMYYISIKADVHPVKVDNKSYNNYVPGEHYINAVFTVRADGLNSAILSLAGDYPLMDDAQQGVVFKLIKKCNNQLEIRPIQFNVPLTPEEIDFISDKNYPKITEFGKKKIFKDNVWIKAAIENSWWYKDFITEEEETDPVSIALQDMPF